MKPGELQKQKDDEEEEEDPLDALMKKNAETLALEKKATTAAVAAPMEVEEEDEVDPLDAFMAAEVLPEVQKLKAKVGQEVEVQSVAAPAAGVGSPARFSAYRAQQTGLSVPATHTVRTRVSRSELQSDKGTTTTHLQRHSSRVQSRGNQALGRQPARFPVAGSEIANSALEN